MNDQPTRPTIRVPIKAGEEIVLTDIPAGAKLVINGVVRALTPEEMQRVRLSRTSEEVASVISALPEHSRFGVSDFTRQIRDLLLRLNAENNALREQVDEQRQTISELMGGPPAPCTNTLPLPGMEQHVTTP